MADGVVRARQGPRHPEVPHLPDSALNCTRGDISNSPVHSVLQFEHCTPNPSAPSPSSAPTLSPPSPRNSTSNSQACCAAVVFCSVCGDECGPDAQHGKCHSCLDAAFLGFAARHASNFVLHSGPSLEGAAASAASHVANPSNYSASVGGPLSAKRARRLSPPHRKAGPPN